MQYVILIIVALAIISAVVELIVEILPWLLAVVGGVLALGAFAWFCSWLWTFTPWYKKRKEVEIQTMIEYEKKCAKNNRMSAR